MEIRPKHVVITLTLLAGAFYLLKNKISDWKLILPQIKAFPIGLRNVKHNSGGGALGTLSFDIDIALFNPTLENFNPDGLLAEIDRVEITAFDELIGTLKVNQGYVNIPAQGKYIMANKRFSIPVNYNLVGIIRKIQSKDDIQIVAIMKVLGSEYRI